MKRFLHAFAMFACLAVPLQMWGQETLTIKDYASANSWSNSTKYETVFVGCITFTAQGGNNTGKYYTDGHEWRFYQTETPSLTISTSDGVLDSIVLTYNVKNSGVLLYGSTPVESNAVVYVSSNSVTFTVGNSGSATNGQVKFTEIKVYYTPGPPTATYFPESNATGVALNVQPTFTFDKAVQKADGSELTAADLVAPLLTFKDAGDNDVDFTATIDDAKKVITVAPSTELAGSTTYTLTLAALKGANGVEQTAANTFSFTTRDANAKSIDNIAADKSRYFWGETAVLTWDAKNLGDDVGAGIRVYKGTKLITDDSDKTIYLPVITAMGIPTNLNSNEAYIPLTDEAFAVLQTTLLQRVEYSPEYKLQVVAGSWSGGVSGGVFTPLNPECVSAQTTDITIIPTPAIETIREYLPAFNGDSLLTTGVVTAVNGTSFAMQGVGAEKSGMYVYQAAGDKVAVGDSVAVLGVLERNTSSKLWQIAKGSAVTRLAADKVLPAPIVRSLTESLLPADSVYQGMLVEISDVVTSVKGADDKADTLLSGANKMVVYNTFMTRNALKSHFVADSTYRVRGIMSTYQGVAQICPRSSFDIAPAIAPVPVFAPANDADKVPLNTPITITFDRPMRKVGGAELTDADLASLIAFKDAAQDTAVLFAATICPSKDTIYIKPSVSLNGPIEYAVTLQPLVDYFGQAMATTTSNFTTLNPKSPHVENAAIAAAQRYFWGEDIVVNFDAKHYTSPTEGYAVLLRDGVRVDSVVIADIAANEATFKLGSGIAADGDTYSTNYTIRVGSTADASATTAPFCVIATPTLAVLNANFDSFTGDSVAITGVVTGAVWDRTTPKNCIALMQDSKVPYSGFYLYKTDSLGIGDSIRVITTVTLFYGIRENNDGAIFTVLGKGTVPEPIELSISDIATDTDNSYQSMLVTIKNAKAIVDGSKVSIDDNTATAMTVYDKIYKGFASNFTNGKTYNVTGLMGSYNGVAQIYPRMAEDIVEVTSTPSTPATPSAVAANTLSVKAYPNPFGNEIKVEGVDVRRVEIYNVVGQLVMQTNAVHDGVVSTANLPSGIYLVRFVDANGRAAVLKMSKR